MTRILWLGLMLAAVCGCARSGAVDDPDVRVIEVVGFGGCPMTPAFLRRVREASIDVGGFTVVYIDQEALAEDDLRRGYAAPSALLDGRDIFGLPVPTSPAMSCRIYEGGLPSREQIAARLR